MNSADLVYHTAAQSGQSGYIYVYERNTLSRKSVLRIVAESKEAGLSLFVGQI